MRVISGTHGGRRFETTAGRDVRPTSDRVRESMFNTLFSMGVLDGTIVADAFAGSGALGIEALSRGAEHVIFIEQEPRAVATVTANLEALDLMDRATIIRGDALEVLPRLTDVEVALCDPPYSFDEWASLARTCPAAVLVAETGSALTGVESWEDSWEIHRSRRYGRTHVTVLRRPQVS